MKLNRYDVATAVGLLLFCVVVFLPPIVYGYVYPNIGDDSAVHLKTIDLMSSGDMSGVGYLGIVLVGFALIWLGHLTNIGIDPLFLWFNYISLALSGISLYFMMSRLLSRKAGWLTLVLTIFCAQGILFQFYFGQIFNIINIAVILPWLLFFTVRYLTEKKIYQLALVILFSGLFGAFHSSGVYLPFIAGTASAVYVLYSLVRKRTIQLRAVIIGAGIVVCSLIVALFIDPYAILGRHGINAVIAEIASAGRIGVPIVDYMLGIVSPTILVGLVFASVFRGDIFKDVGRDIKILLLLLLCGVVLLAVAAFTKISFDSWRTALDLATLLALLVAICIGLFVAKCKNKLAELVLIFAIGFGLFHNLPTWFGYNSSIRQADRQAIAYVNTLDYKTYSCSAEIAPWIYDRFTKAKYEKDGSDLFIGRSEPMTPRSDVKNMWYGSHGSTIGDDFELLQTYLDDEVEVFIYERK